MSDSTVTFTRTRQAYGSQIREALDQLVERGIIIGWKIDTNERDGLIYVLEDERMFAFYKPGKCAAMLNAIGFDIRFGKA